MDLRNFQPKALHLFAGPGGMIKGTALAGIRPAVAVEMQADCCQTLRANYPEMLVREGPIQLRVLADYGEERLEVHTYPYPCKRFSKLAKISGTWTGEHLYLEALREGVLLQPSVILVENVEGMLEYPRVMETWKRLPGYYTTEFRAYGHHYTHQRKPRVILILHSEPYTFAPLEEYALPRSGERLGDYLDRELDPFTLRENPYYLSRMGIGERTYRDRAKIYAPDRVEPVPFFNGYGHDRSTYLVRDERAPFGARPFSPREFARLHGFIGWPDRESDYLFAGEYGSRYQQIADSVMPPMAYAIGRAVVEYFAATAKLKQPQPHLGYREVSSPKAAQEKRSGQQVEPAAPLAELVGDRWSVVQAPLWDEK